MVLRPDEFLWGAATSAHVVEGANFNNDWWRWEQRPGRIADGSTSKVGADFFGRYREDLRLARRLGHRAHFFTLEWSRIEPEQGRFDDSALNHYDGVLETLAEEGLEPVCALHHVTAPAWLADLGWWSNPEAAKCFERYARRVAEAFASKCRWWIPILEPVHTIEMSYIEGAWPPGRGGLLEGPAAFRNMMQGHALAYRALHEQRADALVGASARSRGVRPSNEHSAWDYRAAQREYDRCNRWTFDAAASGKWPRIGAKAPQGIAGTADFLAFSYYASSIVRFGMFRPRRLFARPIGVPRPDPAGFQELVRMFGDYGLPMIVSGNGIAANDDPARCGFLLDHVSALLECLKAGADIRGYFHYSLLDGFEWTEGYGARYGLIHVDTSSQARTPNPSAWLYKDICETGAVRRGAVKKFCPGWGERESNE